MSVRKIKHKCRIFSYLAAVLFAMTFVACSPTKYVPEGQYLLDKVEINTGGVSLKDKNLNSYLRQQPNFKVFSFARFHLGLYNLSGKDSTKWINRTLRSMGEAPTLYDPFLTFRSEQELQKLFKTKGYMNATVKSEVSYKKKKAKVTYTVTPGNPYLIRNINYNFSKDPVIDSLFRFTRYSESKITSGMPLDFEQMDGERDRITQILKRRGYYYFNKDYFSFVADTTIGNHEVDVTMNLKPFMQTAPNGSVTESPHKQYKIRNVNLLTLKNSNSVANELKHYDHIEHSPNTFIYFDGKPLIRPKVLDEELRIRPNQLYNDFLLNYTYSKYNALGAIRSTSIQFTDLHNDQNQLDCSIVLTPNKPQSFSLDVEGTNSSGDLGFAVNVGYQHKNIFRGSELLSMKFRVSEEAISGIENVTDILKDNILEIGGEVSLNFPRFMFPFLSKKFKQRINANTEFKISYNNQSRPEYNRIIMTAGTKYIWNMRRYYRYAFDLFDINYVYMPWISETFSEQYKDPKYSVLRYSYSDHFVFSSGFSVMYDNQSNPRKLHKTYYRAAVESAGNLLHAANSLLNSEKKDGFYVFAKIPYSQYIKGELDYSYNRYIDAKNRIVYHAKIGVAYPYGNAVVVPFEKRFFGGGANSVRGWSVRTLGPGTYSSENQNDFVNQSGDIKLDLNLEYRSKLFWKLELATFIDAGNIWTITEQESQPNGCFHFDTFFKQIALGYGAGLRFDFSYFLLRFDLGVKAFNPALQKSARWRFKGLNWGDDFAFHFAIGYPF